MLTYSRGEIQSALRKVIAHALENLVVPDDGPHLRRITRALIRLAAQIALMRGVSFPAFIEVCTECYLKELPRVQKSSGVAQA